MLGIGLELRSFIHNQVIPVFLRNFVYDQRHTNLSLPLDCCICQWLPLLFMLPASHWMLMRIRKRSLASRLVTVYTLPAMGMLMLLPSTLGNLPGEACIYLSRLPSACLKHAPPKKWRTEELWNLNFNFGLGIGPTPRLGKYKCKSILKCW